ncbi:tetratricopeptide repeat protein [Hyphomonas sp. WL0036]|uniref:tetratricopeptide repeat protein n=1 Tax=Hyphomonas sediminis TaxID=2866160 RepID=UPI001C803069|nr:tetratricopeptide repeat protein [Hyphomonas sediminis]MBY9067017.1 tetratricopeptide repeat protein [Hyphomonas sediminis]
MIHDRHGNPLAGASQKAADLFDLSCRRFARFRGDPVQPLDDALADSPDFGMAKIAKAWLYVTSTEPGATAGARRTLRDLDKEGNPENEREAAHRAALHAATAGNWTASARILDMWSAVHPRDYLALLVGHQIDFLTANARNLRDRIARALPAWDKVPDRSFVLGMLAFGLEEAGDYSRAEAAGREALEKDPEDSWAHHAVAHVMEMQGRSEEGRDFIRRRRDHWAQPDSFLKIHNWWHLALCHLELGEFDAALRLYDDEIRAAESPVAMNLADAAALLWRLHVIGVDVGERWDELADAWTQHADGRCYPFNDMHAAMAFIGAGRRNDALDLLLAAEGAEPNEMRDWMAHTGRPVIEGLVAFDRGHYMEAAELLFPARQIYGTFGGSHAQRDVIDWTLTEAAVRGRLHGLAESLIAERLSLRPGSRINRAFQARSRKEH